MLTKYLAPERVWRYFQNNKEYLKDHMQEIASDKTGDGSFLKVYLTNEYGYPEITVESDSIVVDRDCAINCNDCTSVVARLYKVAESYYADEETTFDEDATYEDYKIVNDREIELQNATLNFLSKVMNVDEDEAVELYGEEIDDIIDTLQDMLFEEFGLSIYRPKIVDIEGKKVLAEYPLEEVY